MTKPDCDSKAHGAGPLSGPNRRSAQSAPDLLEDRGSEPEDGHNDVFDRDTAVPLSADVEAVDTHMPGQELSASVRRRTGHPARSHRTADDIFLRSTTRPERADSDAGETPTRPPSACVSNSAFVEHLGASAAFHHDLWAPGDDETVGPSSPNESAQLLQYIDAQPNPAVSNPPTAGVRSAPGAAAVRLTVDDMRRRYALGDFSGALEAADAICRDQPDMEARTTAASCRDILIRMYSAKIGSLDRILRRTMGDEEVTWLTLDHRAGFLLSLVDGQSTVDELLDISGMSRLNTLKLLSELCEQRILSSN